MVVSSYSALVPIPADGDRIAIQDPPNAQAPVAPPPPSAPPPARGPSLSNLSPPPSHENAAPSPNSTPPPALRAVSIEEPASGEPTSGDSVLPVSAPAERSPTLEYLSEVSFGVEFGSSDPVLRRWQDDLKIRLHGNPTAEDISTLQDVTRELSVLLPETSLEIVNDAGNVDLYFLPESQFQAVEPRYIPLNLGFFRVWWDRNGVIYRGRILVASEGVTQAERRHLIREEVTQTLGLFRDSWRYPDSVFYQGWTTTAEYSPLDREVIKLHYSPEYSPGMTRTQVLGALAQD